jgi:hypothetical protein
MELPMEHIVPEDHSNVSYDTSRVCRLRLKQGANVEDVTCRCSAVYRRYTQRAMSNQFTFVVEPRDFHTGGAKKTILATKRSRPAGLYT